jgi:hypothetical protein
LANAAKVLVSRDLGAGDCCGSNVDLSCFCGGAQSRNGRSRGPTPRRDLRAGDSVFLFDPSVWAPFAVDLRTGERRWTAEADPALPPRQASAEDPLPTDLPRYLRRSQRRRNQESASLAIAGDTLLLSLDGRLVAYAVQDGRR